MERVIPVQALWISVGVWVALDVAATKLGYFNLEKGAGYVIHDIWIAMFILIAQVFFSRRVPALGPR